MANYNLFEEIYDFKVFLSIRPEEQKKRLFIRQTEIYLQDLTANALHTERLK